MKNAESKDPRASAIRDGVNRTAIVAGASSGFGRAVTLALVECGWSVYAGFRGSQDFRSTAESLERDAQPFSGSVTSIHLDITDQTTIDTFVERVVTESGGGVDALVNAVGYGTHGPWESISVEQFRKNLESNLLGPFALARAVVPSMRERGSGRIINFSSQSGLRTNFFEAIYSSTKYGLEGLSLGMRLELQQFGILVSVVCPGWYRGTGYGNTMVISDDMAARDGSYGAMLAAFETNQSVVEQGHENKLHEVTDTVLSILDAESPGFRYVVGCPDVRYIENLDIYEKQIFEFYSLNDFRYRPPVSRQ